MEKRVDNRGRNLKLGESQRKDGMYQFRYTDQAGERKTLYSWRLTTQDKIPDGRKDGKCLRELEIELERSREVIFAGKTVSRCIKEFLDMRTDLNVRTMILYESVFHNHIESSRLGSMLVAQVTKSDVLEFYSELSEKKQLKLTKLRTIGILLNCIFKIAMKDGIIFVNPCAGCLKEFKNDCVPRFALSVEEQHALLDFLKDESSYFSKYYDMIAVFLGTGLRVSELIGLTWDEIDLENGCIHLKHQLLFSGSQGHWSYSITVPKNGHHRLIPLPTTLINIFRKLLLQKIEKNPVVDGVTGFVFLNKNGDLYRISGINEILHRIVDRFNRIHEDLILPDFSAHIFRHTYCTRLIELGVDLKVVQEIMGHASAKMTLNTYTHLNNEDVTQKIHSIDPIDLG